MLDKIIEIVTTITKISEEDLAKKTRKDKLPRARQLVYYLAKQYTKVPLQKIIERLNGKTHSLAVYSAKTFQNVIDTKEEPYYSWYVDCKDYIDKHTNMTHDPRVRAKLVLKCVPDSVDITEFYTTLIENLQEDLILFKKKKNVIQN